MPDSLEYLDLCLTIDPNDLKPFLVNCKHIELNKLLVRNNNIKNTDITFNIFKEFVREKKVKNFAYYVSSLFDSNNLKHQNLAKLVDEAQSFVKMKKYNDLVVRISDFDIM